jgi:hypothetical protein
MFLNSYRLQMKLYIFCGCVSAPISAYWVRPTANF